jgi:Protein of unknown function (DUF3631)
LAVADLAGGEWGLRARQAAVKLSSGRNDGGDDTGEMLIRDIRKVFDARQTSEFPDRIKSEDLCAELAAMESRPWGEWGRTRKPITQNALARQLKPFEIEPWGTVRFGDITLKGYMLKQFDEVFSSYPPENHDSNRHADTTVGGVGESDDFQASQKSERDGWKNGTSPHGENGCDDVPDQNAQNRRVREERQEMDGQPRADEDAYIDRQAEADCPPVCRHCGLEAETDAANCHHCGATYGVERR